MIRILLTDNKVVVEGHARFASRGTDVVCAGVSAIIQTAILGLAAIAEQYGNFVEIDDQRVHSGNGVPGKGESELPQESAETHEGTAAAPV